MFTTGKIVSIGTASEAEAKNSILLTVSDISRIERKKTEAAEITIENVVAVSYVGHQVDIEKL
jgi:TATA-box binding protein (TBP) (component of TFIID and TFIIIB)